MAGFFKTTLFAPFGMTVSDRPRTPRRQAVRHVITD
jgi:hypothetical protein